MTKRMGNGDGSLSYSRLSTLSNNVAIRHVDRYLTFYMISHKFHNP